MVTKLKLSVSQESPYTPTHPCWLPQLQAIILDPLYISVIRFSSKIINHIFQILMPLN